MVTRTKRGETGRARRSSARVRARVNEEAAAPAEPDAAPVEGGPEAGAAAPRNGNGASRARRAAAAIRGPDGLFEDAGSVGTAVAVGVAAAVIESELIPGILIGAGAVLLGKMFPRVAAGVRPVAKSVIRAGLAMSGKAREVVAEAGEQVRDMVAEVEAERQHPAARRPRARRRGGAPAETAA